MFMHNSNFFWDTATHWCFFLNTLLGFLVFDCFLPQQNSPDGSRKKRHFQVSFAKSTLDCFSSKSQKKTGPQLLCWAPYCSYGFNRTFAFHFRSYSDSESNSDPDEDWEKLAEERARGLPGKTPVKDSKKRSTPSPITKRATDCHVTDKRALAQSATEKDAPPKPPPKPSISPVPSPGQDSKNNTSRKKDRYSIIEEEPHKEEEENEDDADEEEGAKETDPLNPSWLWWTFCLFNEEEKRTASVLCENVFCGNGVYTYFSWLFIVWSGVRMWDVVNCKWCLFD